MKKLTGIIILALLVLLPSISTARIELSKSPIYAPVNLAQDDQFEGLDQQQTKNKKKEVKAKPKAVPENKKNISATKAAALSLILPGAGQYYAGASGRAEVFMGWEVLTWAGVYAFHSVRELEERRLCSFCPKPCRDRSEWQDR